MKVALAQINPTVGALENNTKKNHGSERTNHRGGALRKDAERHDACNRGEQHCSETPLVSSLVVSEDKYAVVEA